MIISSEKLYCMENKISEDYQLVFGIESYKDRSEFMIFLSPRLDRNLFLENSKILEEGINHIYIQCSNKELGTVQLRLIDENLHKKLFEQFSNFPSFKELKEKGIGGFLI